MVRAELETTEAALLGACLLTRKAPLIAAEYVASSDFFYPKHRLIFDAILTIVARGDDPDAISVTSELGGKVKEAGGSPYIFSLASLCPAASSVRQYAKAVQNASLDRLVRQEVTEASGRLEGEELLSMLQEKLYGLDRRVEKANTMADVWARMAERGTEPIPPGCEYPWQKVQNLTRGLRPGWLCVLAGEPSHGKTAAALAVTEKNLKNNKRVVYLSLEMGDEEIGLRLAQRQGFSSDRYYRGEMDSSDEDVLGEISRNEYWNNLQLDKVERAAQVGILLRRWKPDLLVIDHLQLLAGGEKLEELSRATRQLKLTAERFRTPILCLSQLSRADKEERTRWPRLQRLRGSGTIEQDADTVLFVWRKRDESEVLTSESALIVAKSRMGRLGSIRAHFDGESQSFNAVTNEFSGPF